MVSGWTCKYRVNYDRCFFMLLNVFEICHKLWMDDCKINYLLDEVMIACCFVYFVSPKRGSTNKTQMKLYKLSHRHPNRHLELDLAVIQFQLFYMGMKLSLSDPLL